MTYRKRKRPPVDPMTGLTYARQRREVPPHYLMLRGEEGPIGAFDLEFWAEDNDQTCDPRSGGLANPTSMAAEGGVSVYTLVNSVLPRMGDVLHHEGPVVISTTNTIAAACRDYRTEQRAKQSEAGKCNASNLISWVRPSDQSSGSAIYFFLG
jgi:hypothetical protein